MSLSLPSRSWMRARLVNGPVLCFFFDHPAPDDDVLEPDTPLHLQSLHFRDSDPVHTLQVTVEYMGEYGPIIELSRRPDVGLPPELRSYVHVPQQPAPSQRPQPIILRYNPDNRNEAEPSSSYGPGQWTCSGTRAYFHPGFRETVIETIEPVPRPVVPAHAYWRYLEESGEIVLMLPSWALPPGLQGRAEQDRAELERAEQERIEEQRAQHERTERRLFGRARVARGLSLAQLRDELNDSDDESILAADGIVLVADEVVEPDDDDSSVSTGSESSDSDDDVRAENLRASYDFDDRMAQFIEAASGVLLPRGEERAMALLHYLRRVHQSIHFRMPFLRPNRVEIFTNRQVYNTVTESYRDGAQLARLWFGDVQGAEWELPELAPHGQVREDLFMLIHCVMAWLGIELVINFVRFSMEVLAIMQREANLQRPRILWHEDWHNAQHIQDVVQAGQTSDGAVEGGLPDDGVMEDALTAVVMEDPSDDSLTPASGEDSSGLDEID